MAARFAGKKALVTGAGKGIGRAVAVALYEAGAETTALSRTQADLDALKAQCPSINTVCVDLQDWVETRAAVEGVGEVDLLVNNAGVSNDDKFMDVSPEDFDKMFNVNVKSVINVSQVVAKGMMSRGTGGSIVNVSSQASKVAIQEHTVYCSTKGALDQITRVMALELGPHKIRVNSVNPTVVLTDMGKMSWSNKDKAAGAIARIPMKRFCEEKEVVGPILFLLSDDAAMVNGDTLMVDGGWTCN